MCCNYLKNKHLHQYYRYFFDFFFIGFSTGLDVGNFIINKGLYINTTSTFTDAITLNDANTVFTEPFKLINSRIGYRKKFSRYNLDLFGGANNLLNQHYSLGNDLNAFGGRYFQPAPGLNFFVGLEFRANL